MYHYFISNFLQHFKGNKKKVAGPCNLSSSLTFPVGFQFPINFYNHCSNKIRSKIPPGPWPARTNLENAFCFKNSTDLSLLE